MSPAALLLRRLDELAAVSETADGLTTRTFGSDAMRRANALVGGWMRAAGLEVSVDNIGNLRGFQPRDGRPLLLLGSHLDTVREAGRFDGPLGVLAGLACIETAPAGLPFRLGVVGFSDEEGVRFGTAYLGSSTLAGHPPDLTITDARGTTLADAVRAFGGDPAALAADRLEGPFAGYVEIHIEQGPVLEAHDLPVGVVTAIAGQSRFSFRFEGQAGHAGTVPMSLRRDALAAAAEFVSAVESRALDDDGLVATVGQLEVRPGAGNVIPGSVTGSLDVRSPDDARRLAACADLTASAQSIAERRRLTLDRKLHQSHDATPCDPALRARLVRAANLAGLPDTPLPSGAGHDGVALSSLMPIAMLFVRCKDGLSHHPAEFASQDDIAVALRVMDNFLRLLQ